MTPNTTDFNNPNFDPEHPETVFKAVHRVLKSAVRRGPLAIERIPVFGALSDLRGDARDRLARTAAQIYNSACEGEATLLTQIAASLESCQRRLKTKYDQIDKEVESMDPYMRINEDLPPLSWPDFANISLIGLICGGLISLPLIGTPSYLLEFVTEKWTLAISVAFLGLALPVTIHSASVSLKKEAARVKFLAIVCLLSFVSVVGWIALNSFSYGGLIVDDGAELPPATIGIFMMALATLAEGTTTAAGWLAIEHILRSRMKVIDRPEHKKLSKEREVIGGQLARSHALSASVAARIATHDNARDVYVQNTLAVYDQLKWRRDFPDDDDFLAGFIKPKPSPKPGLPSGAIPTH